MFSGQNQSFKKVGISFGKISLPSTTASSTNITTPTEETKNEEAKSSDSGAEGGGFGSFSFSKKDQEQQPTPEEEEMNRMMGFSGFKTSKKENSKSAKKFDVKQLVDEIKSRKAKARAENVPTDSTIEVDVGEISLDDGKNNKSGQKKKEKNSKEEKEEDDNDKEKEDEDEDDDDLIGPMPLPPAPSVNEKVKKKIKNSSDSDDDDDSDDEDDDADEDDDYFFPITEELKLVHGSRPISALAVDHTGVRFATGSYDYEVKLWDFNGIKNRHAFRATRPCECHLIRNLSYNLNGESLLVISGSAQAKVLDRDGTEVLETVKGDQYIVDMAKTKGHVAGLTGGQFNPREKNSFMTCSDDGTCRIWDAFNPRQHKYCVKLRSSSGLKNRATCCCYNRDGEVFVAAGFDGSIYLWDSRRPLVIPTNTIKSAHEKNTSIFSVGYSNSGLLLASRGEDAVVNIWDVRNLKSNLFKTKNHAAKFEETDLSFTPDDKMLMIPTLPEGTSGRSKDENIPYSKLCFLSLDDFTYKKEMTFNGEILVKSYWHHRINQIFLTFASGNFSVLYDTNRSNRGAILAHGKGPKKTVTKEVIEDMSVIITPNSLPLFKNERTRNPKREELKARLDPVKSKRPDLPITAGSGGRVAASGSTLSSYVIRNLGLSKSVKDDMDPREAILRYAKEAEENPIWVTPAYKRTQPTPIFTPSEEDDSNKEPDSKKQKIL